MSHFNLALFLILTLCFQSSVSVLSKNNLKHGHNQKSLELYEKSLTTPTPSSDEILPIDCSADGTSSTTTSTDTSTPSTTTSTPSINTTTETSPVTIVNPLQAAQLSASSVDSTGTFTLTAVLPSGSNAKGYTWYESGIEIIVNACSDSSSPITLKITGKAAGTYTYTISLTDGVNSVSSSVTVTVPAASQTSTPINSNPNLKCPLSATNTPTTTSTVVTSGAAWAAGVAYKVGDIVSYNGLTYKCINAHTSISSWMPTTLSLWSPA